MKGRPKGSTNLPQFRNYVTEKERQDFVAWVNKNYKKNPRLATWFGDQLFGKAVQPLGNPDGSSLSITFDAIFTTPTPKGDS